MNRIFRSFPCILVFCCAFAFGQTKPTDNLHGQIEQISLTAKGRVGVALTVLETGESVTFNGSGHFPMQSVYKMPIAMAVLRQVDKGALKLEQKVRVEKRDFVTARQYSPIRDRYPQGVELSIKDLLRYAISESDGTASDVLLRLAGGAQAATAYLRGLGVSGVVIATTEKAMGQNELVQYRNWASPAAMVSLLGALHAGRGLSASSRDLLLQLMIDSTPGPNRIKGLLPSGTIVAHKTGSSGAVNGLARATNDVGIITLPDGRHLAVAVFVSDSRADETGREAVIAKIARAAWDFWSGQSRQ